MTVNSLLKAALEPVAPIRGDTYEGTEPTYIVRVRYPPRPISATTSRA